MPTERYEQVFENNRRWVAEKRAGDPDFFKRLAQLQTPKFLYIGCADSRVPANEIMGLEPGEVMVHRNVANLVVNTDINCQSVIQYAVETLHVEHIIVCGHYGCGGIRAAMEPADHGLLNGWLREIQDVYRLHQAQLDALPPADRARRLVALNVQEQCINVIKSDCVQRRWRTHQTPTVHGWVYDLHNGLLEDLKLDLDGLKDRVRDIYRLGD